MELNLSLGDTRKAFNVPFNIVDHKSPRKIVGTELGFCMSGSKVRCGDGEINDRSLMSEEEHGRRRRTTSSSDRPVQLDLLPLSTLHHHPPISNNLPFPDWLTQHYLVAESERKLEVKRRVDVAEEGASPNSSTSVVSSSLKMNYFSKFTSDTSIRKRDYFDGIIGNNNEISDHHHDHDGDENGGGISRKKLRLTKRQSAFLEHNFKEHHTLNPKQKLALAKQLNLRPRQVEVWFQSRRARTKLKQTEVDCEYLRQCCETLTEENKRLKKEAQELRALNNNSPFYTHLRPATTLTMCPSCQTVVAAANAQAQQAPASLERNILITD